MNCKVFFTLMLLIFFLAPPSFAQELNAEPVEELITGALKNNPELKAARYEISAAKAKIRLAKAWEPPQIGFELFQTPIESFPNPVKDSMESDYYFQQMIPFPKKLSIAEKSARENSLMMEQKFKSMERKIIREVKSAYYDLYFIQKKIALNNENQELTRKFESVAKTQYEVGMGTQADILRSQTELSMLINEENNLKIEKKLAETSINILLYRNPDDQVGLIKNIKENLMEFEYAKLMPLAIKNNSELNEIRQNIEMNNAEIMMAKREYYPDLMFRIMYKDMADTSDDFFSSMFAVNIPLAFWSAGKYKGKVDEETEKLKKTKEDLRAAENMLNLKVREALYGIKTGLNSMLLYENTVIPQANQTLISTLAAYQTGRAEFFSLIEACRTLLAAKQDFYMSEVNYMSNIAALEESVGLNIDEIEQNIK